MGYVLKTKGEILVDTYIQERARLRVYVRKLPDALGGSTPRRAAPNIPSDRALQMDGRLSNNANGRRSEAIPSAG